MNIMETHELPDNHQNAPEIEAQIEGLIKESEEITVRVKDAINSMSEHSEEAINNSEIPALDKRLKEIDEEIHDLKLAQHQTAE